MKKILGLSMVLLLSANAYGQKTKNITQEKAYDDYMPVSPVEYDQRVVVIGTAGQIDTLRVKQLTESKECILKFLPNEAVNVTVKQYNANGTSEYSPASVSAGVGNYTVVMDYTKFSAQKVYAEEGGCYGYAKVGIGLRITLTIETKKEGLNLGNLFGIGIAAEQKQLSGTLSMEILGMEGKEITSLVALPSEISPNSIQNALQAMASIKSQIYVPDTKLYPQIIAIKRTEGSCQVNELIKKATEGKEPVSKFYLNAQQQQQLLTQLKGQR